MPWTKIKQTRSRQTIYYLLPRSTRNVMSWTAPAHNINEYAKHHRQHDFIHYSHKDIQEYIHVNTNMRNKTSHENNISKRLVKHNMTKHANVKHNNQEAKCIHTACKHVDHGDAHHGRSYAQGCTGKLPRRKVYKKREATAWKIFKSTIFFMGIKLPWFQAYSSATCMPRIGNMSMHIESNYCSFWPKATYSTDKGSS